LMPMLNTRRQRRRWRSLRWSRRRSRLGRGGLDRQRGGGGHGTKGWSQRTWGKRPSSSHSSPRGSFRTAACYCEVVNGAILCRITDIFVEKAATEVWTHPHGNRVVEAPRARRLTERQSRHPQCNACGPKRGLLRVEGGAEGPTS
jgi:hypothetical protein